MRGRRRGLGIRLACSPEARRLVPLLLNIPRRVSPPGLLPSAPDARTAAAPSSASARGSSPEASASRAPGCRVHSFMESEGAVPLAWRPIHHPDHICIS